MQSIIEVVLQAGRTAVDVALYTLLPIMVVMMILMRLLEVAGIIDKVVALLGRPLRPFGLGGLAVLALIQVTLVSFVAPLPTMALMEDRGASNRHLAAALAAVLTMAPANASFPIASEGTNLGAVILASILGGLIASSCCYYVFGRGLSKDRAEPTAFEKAAVKSSSLLKIIELSGGEAIAIVIRIIPMLLVSLVLIYSLQALGFIVWLSNALLPLFSAVGLSTELILPTLTKYLAGSTAVVGLYHQLAQQGPIPSILLNNATIGFLIHALDVPGIAIMVSAGPRLARSALPAIAGAVVGILARTLLGMATG